MIRQLMDQQEDLKVQLQDLLEDPDKSYILATVGTYADEDSLIALALAFHETCCPVEEEVGEIDLIKGMELLDNLDTLNFRIKGKKAKKNGSHKR